LTCHELEYTDSQGVVLKARQTNGQLMGSVMSFPILCIINAAICRLVIKRRTGREVALREVPLLVNGDDAVFVTDSEGYRYWEEVATFCGLQPSVGKVYFSDQFFNVNSRNFSVPDFNITPFVNMGLLNDLKRSGDSDARQEKYESVGSKCTELVNLSPPYLKERVLGQFIHKNLTYLASLGVPWFIPEHLHGVGLPIIGEFAPKEYELRFLAQISLEKFPALPRSAWKCWDYATKRLPELVKALRLSLNSASALELNALSHEYTNSLSTNDILGFLCVEAIFRVSGISELYVPTEGKTFSKQLFKFLSKRRTIWNRVLKNGSKSKLPSIKALSDYPPPLPTGSTQIFSTVIKEFSPITVVDSDDFFGDDRLNSFYRSWTGV